MVLLQSIVMDGDEKKGYPFDLPFFNQEICFKTPITIFIGDNGCGKSTLLEIIRAKLNLFRIGQQEQTFSSVRFKPRFTLQKPKGFYFSSEDFTTYIHDLEKEKAWSMEAIREIEETYKHRSELARSLASMPHGRTIHEIENLHDRNLSESSHGEAYLSFFKSRMRPNQLILLDEPETPLSFDNQLTLLCLLKEAVDSGSQIIMATHSPVITAYPNATIYQFLNHELTETTYEQIEQVQLLKSFLNDPKRFFKHLFG